MATANGAEVIADKIAIRDMLHRYCRGLDRMDRTLALSVFHPDSKLDYGSSFQGSGAQFIDWVWPNHARATRHSHNITNCYIEVDGDRAASESYSLMIMRLDPPQGPMIIRTNGRYLDEWVRHEGRWVIITRHSIHEFQEARQLETGGLPESTSSATRDGSDPSYRLLPALFGAP